eukprot:IDg21653t1
MRIRKLCTRASASSGSFSGASGSAGACGSSAGSARSCVTASARSVRTSSSTNGRKLCGGRACQMACTAQRADAARRAHVPARCCTKTVNGASRSQQRPAHYKDGLEHALKAAIFIAECAFRSPPLPERCVVP